MFRPASRSLANAAGFLASIPGRDRREERAAAIGERLLPFGGEWDAYGSIVSSVRALSTGGQKKTKHPHPALSHRERVLAAIGGFHGRVADFFAAFGECHFHFWQVLLRV